VHEVDGHQPDQHDDPSDRHGIGSQRGELAEDDGAIRETAGQERLQGVPFALPGKRVRRRRAGQDGRQPRPDKQVHGRFRPFGARLDRQVNADDRNEHNQAQVTPAAR
jgi:hypothetical protein